MARRVVSILTRLTVCVAIVGALSAVQPGAGAAQLVTPSEGYGFGQGASMQWISPEDINRTLDAVSKTSASWLRVLVDWSRIEPVRGQYDWSHLDDVVNAAGVRHLEVLGVIAYTPDWARAPDTYFTAPPVNPADYAAFAAEVARRYADRVSSWELWNEPNLPLFFGFTPHNAAPYTELLKAAYPAIKAVQPRSTVVAAGLSRLIGDESPPAFLAQMYAAGAKGYFDAAAAHPYVSPDGLAADPENGWSDVGRMNAVMVANGDGAKKIWMTEIGAPTSDSVEGVSQQEQARQIVDVLAAAAATGYSGPAFIYSIRDVDTANRGDREFNYGALLTSEWQPKFTAGVLAR
jgi:polysaccharide biosynthesis protein PslG